MDDRLPCNTVHNPYPDVGKEKIFGDREEDYIRRRNPPPRYEESRRHIRVNYFSEIPIPRSAHCCDSGARVEPRSTSENSQK